MSLADHCNYKTYLCCPSIKTLCEESGMGSNNTASRAIVALQIQGVIRIKQESRRAATQYEFNGYPESWDLPSSATVEPPSDATVEPSSAPAETPSDASVTPSGATVDASGATVDNETSGVMQQWHTNPTNSNPTLNPTLNPTFDSFWKAYPKRKSKGQAEEVWKKLSCEDQVEIISHLQRRVGVDREWLKEGGKYIPYPATFLSAKGWRDEWGPAQRDYSSLTEQNINNLREVSLQ